MTHLSKHYPSLSSTSSVNVASSIPPHEKELIRIHKQAILALGNYNRCQAQWTDLIDRALHLEDVAKNEQQSSLGAKGGEFVRTYKKIRSPILEALCSPKIGMELLNFSVVFFVTVKRLLFRMVLGMLIQEAHRQRTSGFAGPTVGVYRLVGGDVLQCSSDIVVGGRVRTFGCFECRLRIYRGKVFFW